MKTMYFNQYQIESAETERYADNHKLIANALGFSGEVKELIDDVISILCQAEKEQFVDLSLIITSLREASENLTLCGSLEKHIRKFHTLGAATPKQEDDFKIVEIHPSPEQIEHLEGEAGDCLFHLARLLASVNVDLEHCAIKNRMKLTKRLRNNEITDHQDH